MATNMATSDPIYHQQTMTVTGNTGVIVSTGGHYTSPNVSIGLNLHSNHDFQSLFSRLVRLENEVHNLRERLNFIETNPQLEEKFESLKRAGEEYRLIEKLVFGPAGERNGTS